MHPLITALINREKLRDIQPREWSPYRSTWLRMWNENGEMLEHLVLEHTGFELAFEIAP